MDLITEEEIQSIVNSLREKGLLYQPLREISIYTVYRIEKLLKKQQAISYPEIKYNLCEIGPGRRRLDTFTLDLVLSSSMFNRLSNLKRETRQNIDFFYRNKPDAAIEEIVKAKLQFISSTFEAMQSEKMFQRSLSNLTKQLTGSGFEISEENINPQKSYIECIVKNPALNASFLFRYYNIRNWVYPSSVCLWDLYQKAADKKSLPILIAPYIHVSCFQLFKALGVFARQTYNFLISEKQNCPDILRNLGKGMSLGIFHQAKDADFSDSVSLLSQTVPSHHHTFELNFNRMSERIQPILKKHLPEAVENLFDIISEEIKFRGVPNLKLWISRKEALVASLSS